MTLVPKNLLGLFEKINNSIINEILLEFSLEKNKTKVLDEIDIVIEANKKKFLHISNKLQKGEIDKEKIKELVENINKTFPLTFPLTFGLPKTTTETLPEPESFILPCAISFSLDLNFSFTEIILTIETTIKNTARTTTITGPLLLSLFLFTPFLCIFKVCVWVLPSFIIYLLEYLIYKSYYF